MNQTQGQTQQKPQGPQVRAQDVYVIIAADQHDDPYVRQAIKAREDLKSARIVTELPIARLSDLNAVIVAYMPPPEPHEVATGNDVNKGKPERPARARESVVITKPVFVAEHWKLTITDAGEINKATFCTELAQRCLPMVIKTKPLHDGMLVFGAA